MQEFSVAVLETREEMVVYFVTAETKKEAVEKALNYEWDDIDPEGAETVKRVVKHVEKVVENG